MSFHSSSALCVLCSSQPSTALCEGCHRKFCLTCLAQHRNELSNELDDLFNRRNELVEIMSNQNSTDRGACFDEIERWRNDMHITIDRVASNARENIRQNLIEANKNVRKELDFISQDLQQRQKTGGYVEGDLNRLKEQLIKLKDIVQQGHEQIHIDTSPARNIPWDSFISIRLNNGITHVVPPSPNLYSSARQRASFTASLPYQTAYSVTSTPTSTPRTGGNLRTAGRSASVSMNSRPLTYTCIGCKSTNTYNEHGGNVCSVCRCPPPL